MFSTSHLHVAAILDEKRAAAAAERLVASPSTTSLTSKVVGAGKSLWSLLSGPAERPYTPTLVNYPFRGA
jgi:hypothetical protein